METLTFWPLMDEEYMWRWYCYDGNRDYVARSAKSFFSRADVELSIKEAKRRMVQAAAA